MLGNYFFNGYLLLLVSAEKNFNCMGIACSNHSIETLVHYAGPSSVLKHLELLALQLKTVLKNKTVFRSECHKQIHAHCGKKSCLFLIQDVLPGKLSLSAHSMIIALLLCFCSRSFAWFPLLSCNIEI